MTATAQEFPELSETAAVAPLHPLAKQIMSKSPTVGVDAGAIVTGVAAKATDFAFCADTSENVPPVFLNDAATQSHDAAVVVPKPGVEFV